MNMDKTEGTGAAVERMDPDVSRCDEGIGLIVKASGVKNGTVCVASHHTTRSVMVQKCSYDIDTFDLEYPQHDLLDIMRKMIPDFAEEHQYAVQTRSIHSMAAM